MDIVKQNLWIGDAVWELSVRLFVCRNSDEIDNDDFLNCGQCAIYLSSNKTMNFIAGSLGLKPVRLHREGKIRNVGKFGADALEASLGEHSERHSFQATVEHCVELLEARVDIPQLVAMSDPNRVHCLSDFRKIWK